MKVIINIPTEKVKQVAGVAALMLSDGVPDGLGHAIDEAAEVDITDMADSGDDSDTLMIRWLAICAMSKIATELEAKAGND